MTNDLTRVIRQLMAQVASGSAFDIDSNRIPEGDVCGEDFGQRAWRRALLDLLSDEHAISTPSAQSSRFRVSAVVRDVTDALVRELPERLKLTLEHPAASEEREVEGDRAALESLIIWQAARAVHGVGAGAGRILVRVERVGASEARADCPELPRGPYLRLLMETLGAGEPTANGLDPFFATNGSAGSWSLGRALARRAAGRLGGVIHHAPDRSTCKAYLPLSATLEPRVHPSQVSVASRSGAGLDVLYVSDEEPILAMGRPALLESDCCVSVVDCGQDALGHLRSRTGGVDVVVIEDGPQDMPAADLASELQSILRELPVVVAAAERRPEELREHLLERPDAKAPRAALTKTPTVESPRKKTDSRAR